ncbi:hypothetical protein [Flavobacterium sp. WC2430]|uniref:hypothetical protein n=1 Tax=Flavobacterium sp. WC2430 TaxID=3234137 RepID=UPI0034669C13
MKKLLFILLIPFFSFAQKPSKLEKRLNEELKIELKEQSRNPYFSGDTLVVVQEFKIDQNKVLSYQTNHKMYNGDVYYIRKQEVALKDIISIGKDICVLLETNDKVKITDTNYHSDGTKDTSTQTQTYFRTQFCNQKNNEYLGNELVELFKKEGYTITISHWYD